MKRRKQSKNVEQRPKGTSGSPFAEAAARHGDLLGAREQAKLADKKNPFLKASMATAAASAKLKRSYTHGTMSEHIFDEYRPRKHGRATPFEAKKRRAVQDRFKP